MPTRPDEPNFLAPFARYDDTAGGTYDLFDLGWPDPELFDGGSRYTYHSGQLNGPSIDPDFPHFPISAFQKYTPILNNYVSPNHIDDEYFGMYLARDVGSGDQAGNLTFVYNTDTGTFPLADTATGLDEGGTYNLIVKGTFHRYGGAETTTWRELSMFDDVNGLRWDFGQYITDDDFEVSVPLTYYQAYALVNFGGQNNLNFSIVKISETDPSGYDLNPPTEPGYYGVAIWKMGIEAPFTFGTDPGDGGDDGGDDGGSGGSTDPLAGSNMFGDAPLIPSIPFVSPATPSSTYTEEPGENTDNGYQSAWWQWVPAENYSIVADTSLTTGPRLDTRLALWRETNIGEPANVSTNLTRVKFNDDVDPDNGTETNGGYLSELSADVTAGRNYWFEVAAYNTGYDQIYKLRVYLSGTTPPGGGGSGGGGGDEPPESNYEFPPTVLIAGAVEGKRQVVAFNAQPGYGQELTPLELGVSDGISAREYLPTDVELLIAGAQPGEVVTLRASNGDYENPIGTKVVSLGSVTVDAEGNYGPFSVALSEAVSGVTVTGFGDPHFFLVATSPTSQGYAVMTYFGPDISEIGSTNPGVDGAPVAIPGSAGSWVMQDLKPGGLGSWVMDINPTTMTPPHLAKVAVTQHTTDPETGAWHIGESNLDSPDWTLNGFCPNKTFYDKLMAYGALKRRFYVIDHRGRAWKVAVQSLQLTPRNRKTLVLPGQSGAWEDWMNDYQLTLAIYGQEFVIP